MQKVLNMVNSPLKFKRIDLVFGILIQLIDKPIPLINDQKLRLRSKEFDIEVTDNIPFDTVKINLI